MQRTDKARGEAGNRRSAVLLIALLLALLVTCAPTAPVVTTSVPPTEAPTEAPLPTSTIVTPPSAYATQDAARRTSIVARATASPFPTAGPSTIQTGQPSKARARRDGLSLELWLTKDTYLAGEGGQAEVTLRNDGPETFYVVGAGGHIARPVLLDQRGHEPAPWPWPPLPMIGWVPLPQELSPGQVLTGTLTFQVPPPDQALAHSYVLWAEVSFARAMPDQPQGPDNLWLRLEAGPIPLQLLAPSAAQQLHAELQADSYGWMLRVTDAKGETPPGPFWGQLEATSRNGSLAQPLAHEPGGSWSASLDPYLTADGAQLALRAWVAAPGYVTAAATQTVPGVGSDSKPFYTGEPTDGQRYDTLEAAQAASLFPIYRPGFLPARTTLDGIQVDTWTLDEGYRAEATQIYRLRSDDWLELTQAASDPFWPDSGWGEARYDSEAEVIVIEQTLGYAIRHFGWWLLDWKCGDIGLELRAPMEALSLDELVAVAAGVRSPDGTCPLAPIPAPPTQAPPPTPTTAPSQIRWTREVTVVAELTAASAGSPDPTCVYGGSGWERMLAYDADGVDDAVRALLSKYSQALSSGRIAHPGFYSPSMQELIAGRRAYYQEFHQMALHSSLLGISSRYKLDSVVPDAVEDGLYHVQAVEMVTTTGRYREPTPEECTSARAALWALARTDHPAVQQALQEYITREMARYLARFDTVSNYDIVWIVRHQLLIRAGENGFTVVQDTFDDKASDNPEGYDVVSWVDGRFVRHKPDWTVFPDYVMYHESLEKVESLGRSLLQDKTRTYGGTPVPDPHPGWLTYTHATYGFSFRYPPGWTVVSQPDVPNLVWLRRGAPAVLELTIGFRWPGEEAPIQRTGVGAGEIETQGTVRFLGRELARGALIYEGKVKAILYNNACEFDVDGLIFTLSLDDRSLDYDAAQIEPEMQAIADEIVESFLLSSD